MLASLGHSAVLERCGVATTQAKYPVAGVGAGCLSQPFRLVEKHTSIPDKRRCQGEIHLGNLNSSKNQLLQTESILSLRLPCLSRQGPCTRFFFFNIDRLHQTQGPHLPRTRLKEVVALTFPVGGHHLCSNVEYVGAFGQKRSLSPSVSLAQ